MSKISIIIPVFNEERSIGDCIQSLLSQDNSNIEIILVDDGSKDKSLSIIESFKENYPHVHLLKQSHKGPAAARNAGAKHATGNILVFVDADMEFDKKFISQLVKPILEGKTKGTFSKEEYILNRNNIWSLCWNINRYMTNGWKLNNEALERILPSYYPDEQQVFRAILRNEFEQVGGFDNIGYTDDWTLFRKLGYRAKNAPDAIYFHRNPDSLSEAFGQAKWIGKNEFISGTFIRKCFNLLRYSFIFSLIRGIQGALNYRIPPFFLFKILYDAGVFVAILETLITSSRNKT